MNRITGVYYNFHSMVRAEDCQGLSAKTQLYTVLQLDSFVSWNEHILETSVSFSESSRCRSYLVVRVRVLSRNQREMIDGFCLYGSSCVQAPLAERFMDIRGLTTFVMILRAPDVRLSTKSLTDRTPESDGHTSTWATATEPQRPIAQRLTS